MKITKDQFLMDLVLLYQLNGQPEQSYQVCQEAIQFIDSSYTGNQAIFKRCFYNFILGKFKTIEFDLEKVDMESLNEEEQDSFQWWSGLSSKSERRLDHKSVKFRLQLFEDMDPVPVKPIFAIGDKRFDLHSLPPPPLIKPIE